MAQMTAFSKLLVVGLVLGGLYGGYRYADTHGMIPKGKPTEDIKPGAFNTTSAAPDTTADNSASATQASSGGLQAAEPVGNYGSLGRPIRISVVTWGGYAGGEYFNRGFKDNAESMFRKKFGVPVEFVLQPRVVEGGQGGRFVDHGRQLRDGVQVIGLLQSQGRLAG